MERFASIVYFRKAITTPDINLTETYLKKAISINPNDLYYRSYAQFYLSKMNTLIEVGTTGEEARTNLQAYFNEALSALNLAVEYNPKNYFNHEALASLYRNVASQGVDGAALKSIESYEKALQLNPSNPGIKLSIALGYLSLNNLKEARKYGEDSLLSKPDFIDALIVLSRIEKLEGNNLQALNYAEKALVLAPQNKDLISYVNSLKGLNFNLKEEDKEDKKNN